MLNFITFADNVKAFKILLENGASPNAYNKKYNRSVLDQAFSASMFHNHLPIDILFEYIT